MTPLVRRFFTREVVSQIRMRPAVDRNAAFPLHSRIDNGSAIFPSTVMPIESQLGSHFGTLRSTDSSSFLSPLNRPAVRHRCVLMTN
uniref:Uncharacterized protein n=1 Tax=Steinernema glaseri TaxID=37863 RepID=A0A1I7YED0_9BILA